MKAEQVKIHPEWRELLRNEFESEYFEKLKLFLEKEKEKYTIYPRGDQIFSAFNMVGPYDVKVVIIGQDPYHGAGQAHGLCFSVPDGIHPPPSLVNIFKEITSDLGIERPQSGNLESWAKQGVLLLNSTLTVRANTPKSHFNKGWEIFTDRVIQILSEKQHGIVFLLWGAEAKQKVKFIDQSKHFILTTVHPSPLSAYGGFFGCKHFSKTNEILAKQNRTLIDWRT